jgi:hypothetical protein
MDPVIGIGSSLPARQTELPATRDVGSAGFGAAMSAADANPAAMLDASHGSDPAAEPQRMLHFMSHVNAECFISLLKIVDPKPDDYRARSEYKRYYQQLRETLEVPLPPQEPQPVRLPTE